MKEVRSVVEGLILVGIAIIIFFAIGVPLMDLEFIEILCIVVLLGFVFGFVLTDLLDVGGGFSSTLAGLALLLYPLSLLVILFSGGAEGSVTNLDGTAWGIWLAGFLVSFVTGVHSRAWIIQGRREAEKE